MAKINCDVCNCSYNNSGVCFSNRVDIGGMASSTENDTCDCLVCKVSSCEHNENCLCTLSSIQVNGSEANLYTETNCGSFDKK